METSEIVSKRHLICYSGYIDGVEIVTSTTEIRIANQRPESQKMETRMLAAEMR